MPLAIQQEISVNESTSLSAECVNICYKSNALQPYPNVQPGKFHMYFTRFFSTEPNTGSLSQETHLLHTKSDTHSPESKTSPSKNKVCLSRSLQDIGPFSSSPTNLDALTSTSSQDNLLQVPAMATNAVVTTTTYDSLARLKSTSFICSIFEGVHDKICDLVSPDYIELPSS